MPDTDQFSNGLISDLSPLIALFGEQVTKQYMSQTMYWSDHIIFAMAPLGILTAMVGAIRVAGPIWLKTIIGRARESRGSAEVELMSSTSRDVCELWNGRQIVRVLGSAPVKQVLYFPHMKENYGLYTLETAVAHGLLTPHKDSSRVLERLKASNSSYTRSHLKDAEGASTDASFSSNSCAPNITLNFGNPVSHAHLTLAAIVAVVIQTGVLLFEGLCHYRSLGGFASQKGRLGRLAFVLTVVGTLLLCLGMILCSYVVEQCTEETVWRSPTKAHFYLFWVQKGQVVNDQHFHSFVLVANSKRRLLMTSNPILSQGYAGVSRAGSVGAHMATSVSLGPHRQGEGLLAKGGEEEEEGRHPRLLEWITVAATFFAISGFTLQFVGIRGLHWVSMVMQVATTLVMTVIRAAVRHNLASKPFSYSLPPGFELEWLSMQLGGGKWFQEEEEEEEEDKIYPASPSGSPPSNNSTSWYGRARKSWWSSTAIPSDTHARMNASAGTNLGWDISCQPLLPNYVSGLQFRVGAVDGGGDESEGGNEDEDMGGGAHEVGDRVVEAEDHESMPLGRGRNTAATILGIRERLGILTGWDGPAAEESFSLTAATELVLNKLRIGREVDPNGMGSINSILCPLNIKLHDGQAALPDTVYLVFENDQAEGSSKWKANENQIEALMSLWLFSLSLGGVVHHQSTKKYRRQRDSSGREERMRYLGQVTPSTEMDFEWWLDGNLAKIFHVSVSLPATSPSPPLLLGYAPFHQNKGHPQVLNTGQMRPADLMALDEATATADFGEVQKHQYYAMFSYSSSAKSCAQHLYSVFLLHTAAVITQVDGHTTKSRKNAQSSTWGGSTYNLTLQSTILHELAEGVSETGLCTLEEAYIGIIPALSVYNKLPKVHAVVDWARETARYHESIGHWDDAASVNLWLFSACKRFGSLDEIAMRATFLLGEFTRLVTITNVLWASQYRKGPSVEQLARLQAQLTRVLHEDASFSALYGDLLLLSTMYRKLDPCLWAPNSLVEPTTATADSPVVEARTWPQGFNHTRLHQAALLQVGWRLPSILKEDPLLGISHRDILGRVALHYAAANPTDAAKWLLLRNGADPRTRDWLDWTPLHYASWPGNVSAVRVLTEAAEVDAVGRDDRTPLHCAASRNTPKHTEIAELLLGAGANAELLDKGRRSALHWAAYAGSIDIVRLLLTKGVYPRGRDDYGRTPLHLAALGRGDLEGDSEAAGHGGGGGESNIGEGLGETSGGCRGVIHTLLDGNKDNELETELTLQAQDRDGSAALHLAAAAGAFHTASLLIWQGANIEAKDQRGETALHIACGAGHAKVVELLLLKHNAPNTPNNDGIKPFEVAFMNFKQTVADLLLLGNGEAFRKKGLYPKLDLYDIVVTGRYDTTSAPIAEAKRGESESGGKADDLDVEQVQQVFLTDLHTAAEKGTKEDVELLLQGDMIELDGCDEGGKTALFHAAMNHDTRVAKFLLERGAEINFQGSYGGTAVQVAAHAGNTGVVRILKEHGADMLHANHYGNVPIHFAAWSGDLDTVRFLVSWGQEPSKKHCASILSNPSSYGNTAMHFAAASGVIETMKFILDHGGHIEETNYYGNVPLHIASMSGHKHVVNFLVEQGADINLCSKYGNNALHFAALGGRLDVVQQLLEMGLDIMGTDDEGLTALHFASIRGHRDAVRQLLHLGAQIGSVDAYGATPLHLAAAFGQLDIVKILLEKGADEDSTDMFGDTASTHAQRNGHWEVAKLLKGELQMRFSLGTW